MVQGDGIMQNTEFSYRNSQPNAGGMLSRALIAYLRGIGLSASEFKKTYDKLKTHLFAFLKKKIIHFLVIPLLSFFVFIFLFSLYQDYELTY